MSASSDKESAPAEGSSDLAHEVWRLMADLVLDNQRRREVAEAAGMSFGRTRAVRRVAQRPMSMSDLASVLGIERSNATALINELEEQGLVVRKADPEDRRARLVVATRQGKDLARRADEILNEPPEALAGLGRDDLEALRRILGGPADRII